MCLHQIKPATEDIKRFNDRHSFLSLNEREFYDKIQLNGSFSDKSQIKISFKPQTNHFISTFSSDLSTQSIVDRMNLVNYIEYFTMLLFLCIMRVFDFDKWFCILRCSSNVYATRVSMSLFQNSLITV